MILLLPSGSVHPGFVLSDLTSSFEYQNAILHYITRVCKTCFPSSLPPLHIPSRMCVPLSLPPSLSPQCSSAWSAHRVPDHQGAREARIAIRLDAISLEAPAPPSAIHSIRPGAIIEARGPLRRRNNARQPETIHKSPRRNLPQNSSWPRLSRFDTDHIQGVSQRKSIWVSRVTDLSTGKKMRLLQSIWKSTARKYCPQKEAMFCNIRCLKTLTEKPNTYFLTEHWATKLDETCIDFKYT